MRDSFKHCCTVAVSTRIIASAALYLGITGRLNLVPFFLLLPLPLHNSAFSHLYLDVLLSKPRKADLRYMSVRRLPQSVLAFADSEVVGSTLMEGARGGDANGRFRNGSTIPWQMGR